MDPIRKMIEDRYREVDRMRRELDELCDQLDPPSYGANHPNTTRKERPMHVWLDDYRFMPSNFDHHATTAPDAIRMLESGAVETISLDHDLGDESNGTGYDVARWIEAAAYYNSIPPVRWMIHSSNPVGAVNMARALHQADRHWEHHGYSMIGTPYAQTGRIA